MVQGPILNCLAVPTRVRSSVSYVGPGGMFSQGIVEGTSAQGMVGVSAGQPVGPAPAVEMVALGRGPAFFSGQSTYRPEHSGSSVTGKVMHSLGSCTQGSIMVAAATIKALLTVSQTFAVGVRVSTFGSMWEGSKDILVDGEDQRTAC